MFPVLVLSLLIAVNALYVAAEFAAVASQRANLALMARAGNRRAQGLLAMLQDGVQLDRFVAACQIGITLSSLVAGAYAQATLGLALAPWLETTFALGPLAAHSSSFVLVLLVLTVLQVVLGELLPKSLALQYPERTALATFLPLRLSLKLFGGFIWLLNGSGFLLLRPFGIHPGGHRHVHSPEELSLMLAEAREGGEMSAGVHQRLERGLQLSSRRVRQLMTPRSALHGLEVATAPEQVIKVLRECRFSRLPVYRGSMDQILGAINTREVAALLAREGKLPPLERLVRPIPFVPESLLSHQLIKRLREEHSSKAIVLDEYGGVSGLVSIQDVLGELFGELGDELKSADPGPECLPDGRVRLPGHLHLDDASHWLPQRWEGESTTVGGHIVDQLGRLPQEGEEVEIQGVPIQITQMGRSAVRWVTVLPSCRACAPAPPSKEDGKEC